MYSFEHSHSGVKRLRAINYNYYDFLDTDYRKHVRDAFRYTFSSLTPYDCGFLYGALVVSDAIFVHKCILKVHKITRYQIECPNNGKKTKND